MPLKNISITALDATKKGEAVITEFGIEGGAIYALSKQIRQQLNEGKQAVCYIDLKPTLSIEDLITALKSKPSNSSMSKYLESTIHLSKAQLALLKNQTTQEDFFNNEILTKKIKALPLHITGLGPIDEAISTTGGIALNEIDNNFQFKKWPAHYAIGEMLDWDAPTGGYLLQACFSMGYKLAEHLNTL